MTCTHSANNAALVEIGQMKSDRWMYGDETSDLSASLEAIDHVRQRGVGQAVAVIREKYFLILDEMTDRNQTLTDVAPYSRVDERDPPICGSFAQQFDLLAKLRDRAVTICRLLVVEEVVLHDVRFIAKA